MRLIDANWILGEIEYDLGCYEIGKLAEDDGLYVELRDVVKMVCAAPTVDPASLRPKGEWISAEVKPHLIYECSLCKSKWGYGAMLHMNFCPNCGADMRGEANDS